MFPLCHIHYTFFYFHFNEKKKNNTLSSNDRHYEMLVPILNTHLKCIGSAAQFSRQLLHDSHVVYQRQK